MMRIFTYTNCISFTSNRDIETVIEETQELLREKLYKLKPTKLKRNGNALHFSSGMFRFVWNWNLLNAITEGTIQLEQNDKNVSVKYKLNFTELIVISLLFTLPIFLIWTGPIIEKIVLFIVLNLWFLGGNAGITIFRYNRFIKQSIDDILERDSPSIPKEQEEWISNNFKCDACGYSITADDESCPDCGIRLREKV